MNGVRVRIDSCTAVFVTMSLGGAVVHAHIVCTNPVWDKRINIGRKEVLEWAK